MLDIESWLKVYCPHCDRPNWTRGSIDDEYLSPETDGFRCWKCDMNVPLNDFLDIPLDEDEETIEFEYEKGLKFPPKD